MVSSHADMVVVLLELLSTEEIVPIKIPEKGLWIILSNEDIVCENRCWIFQMSKSTIHQIAIDLKCIVYKKNILIE